MPVENNSPGKTVKPRGSSRAVLGGLLSVPEDLDMVDNLNHRYDSCLYLVIVLCLEWCRKKQIVISGIASIAIRRPVYRVVLASKNLRSCPAQRIMSLLSTVSLGILDLVTVEL
jgi:hypothetical protein